MKKWLITLFLLPWLALPVHAEEEFDEGFQFARITTPVEPVNTKSDKVEVVELFWYGCGHCYSFEPHLHGWLENKPENIEFVRVPAIFANSGWELHARAYYTAEVLGVLDKTHSAMFSAIHKDKRRLASEKELAKFFSNYGVDEKKFKNTFNSFAVDMKVKRAERLTSQYAIEGVPAMVVAGKFRTDGPMAHSYKNMLQVVDYLVAGEQGSIRAASNQTDP